MRQVADQIRQLWASSRAYRITLVIAVVYTVFRLAVHGTYLTVMLFPNQNMLGELPGWVEADEPMIPDDLRIYLDAAMRLRSRQDLYLSGTVDRMEFYQYPPFYALAFVPFLWMPRSIVAIVHTILHILIYGLLYAWWGRIFHQLGFERGVETLAWTLPVWLTFTAFWSDLGYLNVYILTTLLSTWLIDAILSERLGWSLLWLSVILQIKPQWAFAAALPLILGNRHFFIKLLALALVSYAAIAGIMMLILGPAYGWQQQIDYFRLLRNIQGGDYPWRGPDMPFLGYNHSIKQIVVFLLGVTPRTLHLATGIKVLLLLPLGVIITRCLFQPIGLPGRLVPQLALELVFVLYLAAFIWLDVVWEISLGIAVFTYLLATLSRRWAKALIWGVFSLYCLIDPLRTLGGILALFDMNTILPGLYILTDPSIYVPAVMMVILTFYALLVKRLWQSLPMRQSTGLVSS